MSIIGEIQVPTLQWYALRMKPPRNANRTTALIGTEKETYRDRMGRPRKRSIKGTGKRVFVHEHILRRQGFEVFLPVRKEWRQKNRYSPAKELVAYPLLTGWLFVGWPTDQMRWHDLAKLDIVTGVMGARGRPVQLSGKTIAKLMRRWGGGYLAPKHHRYLRTHKEFEVGTEVKICIGPFEDFCFEVLDISSDGVSGVLQLFGRDVPVTFSPDELEPLRW